MKTVLLDIIKAAQDKEDRDNLKPSINIDDKDGYGIKHPELEKVKPFPGTGGQTIKEEEAAKIEEEEGKL
jgi:hypothetical protein